MVEHMVDTGVVRGLRAVAEHLRSVGAHSPSRVVDLGELCRRGNVAFEVLGVIAAALRAMAREAEVAGRLPELSDRAGDPDPRARAAGGAARLARAAQHVERAVTELRAAGPLLTTLRAGGADTRR